MARPAVRKAQALLDAGSSREAMRWLLTEAFADDRGGQLLDAAGYSWSIPDRVHHDPWAGPVRIAAPLSADVALVQELIRDADTIPRYTRPRYWSARHWPPEPIAAPLTLQQTTAAFAETVLALEANGYFENAFGSYCSDRTDRVETPDTLGQQRLADLLDTDVALWPLRRADPAGGGPGALVTARP